MLLFVFSQMSHLLFQAMVVVNHLSKFLFESIVTLIAFTFVLGSLETPEVVFELVLVNEALEVTN